MDNNPIQPSTELFEKPAPPTNGMKTFLIFIIVLAVIAVVGAGGYLLGAKTLAPKETTQPIVSSPTIVPTAIPSADPTANWKIYRSEKADFQIKYPSEWFEFPLNIGTTYPLYGLVTLSANDKNNTIKGEIQISYWDNSSRLSLEEMENKYKGEAGGPNIYFPNGNYITFLGVKAFKGDNVSCDPMACDRIAIVKDDKIIEIKSLYIQNNTNKEIYNQILSTFRFTDQAQVTPEPTISNAIKINYTLPAGWKTIADETGTFEVGYNSEDSNTSLTYNKGMVSIFKKPVLSASFSVGLYNYDGGSRHAFIFKQMGIDQTKGDAPEKYKEVEYLYNGRSCLFLENFYYSQFPDVWGMCDAGGGKAFLITTYYNDTRDYLQWLKTVRVIK